jgi:ribose 5-phosphate isomerase A
MLDRDQLKARAAHKALEMIEDDMIIGLGTGTTVRYFLEELSKKLISGELRNISGIPSSKHTEQLAGSLAIPLTTFEQHSTVDIAIDGADEVDPELNLIKGGGGALLREKIMAQATRRFVVIIDESKYSKQLGTLFGVPVEVLPFAYALEQRYLQDLGAEVSIRKQKNGAYFCTDQANYILDCDFGRISDAEGLAQKMDKRAGILEHGLFLSVATDVIIATPSQTKHLHRS